jgi:antitoxin VapB
MKTAKLFTNGRSQAVRLPRECNLPGEAVYVQRIGDVVVLTPMTDPWAPLRASLAMFTEDYMNNRNQPDLESREPL